ncbi:MAG: hypothetical protein GWP14_07270 [Actinobacteria bacterium]|nr:hypothetical protein [Actinomycetota bacterium]
MASRRGRLKGVGLIILGFVAGAVLAGGFVAWSYFQLFKRQYYDGILSNANTAYMIRAGREKDLLKGIEDNMQQCVVAADAMWGENKTRLAAFWLVQRYYEKFDLPIPEDVRPILDGLPPRPLTSCELDQSRKIK